jgi:murein DD-endopeptidase MepM/ murein hydrolase activator NlpD
VIVRAAALVTALAGSVVGSTGAQSPETAVTIRPRPALPLRGAVTWIEVEPERSTEGRALRAVEGDAAGEPLHFSPEGRGFAALAGVPLEGQDSLEIVLRLLWDGRTDTTRVVIALASPTLRSEKLRVRPALANPDSAARARIEREQALSRQVSQRSHQTPRLWSGRFRLPRPSRITSVYGTAREYNGEITSRHLGTDFAGKTGAPVRAAGRGVVALVADFYLAGRAVYLDHGAGLVTGYFHLSRIDVAEGDTVAAGQTVGAVGRSGRVTGPHLHWIARYGTITVDPMSLVRLGGEVSGGK